MPRRNYQNYKGWKGLAPQHGSSSNDLFKEVDYERRDVSFPAALGQAVCDCLDDIWDQQGHGGKHKLGFLFVYDLMSGGMAVPAGVDPRRMGRLIMGCMLWKAATGQSWELYKRLFHIHSYLHDNPSAAWPPMTITPTSSDAEKLQVLTSILAVCTTLGAEEAKALEERRKSAVPASAVPPVKVTMNRSELGRTFRKR